MSVGADFSQHMEAVARALLGMPNNQLSNGKKLRFGTHGSMSVDIEKGVFHSFEENIGGGVLDLIKRVKGLDRTAAVDWMRDELQLPVGEPRRDRRIVDEYPYRDEAGNLLFQVLRYEPKDFRQRRPKGAGGWSWSVKGVRQVPYRLPELIEALALDRPVVIVEGEKDADALAQWSIPATCNAGGAGKWCDALNEHFRGADVVINPDIDPQATKPDGTLRFHPDGRPVFTGQDHARNIAAKLASFARRIRILELPGPGKDVSDWISSGGTADEFWRLVDTVAKAPADYVGPGVPRLVLTLQEFLAGFVAPDYLVDGLLQRGYFYSLTAMTGAGKTAVALLLAVLVADPAGGKQFGPHKVEHGRIVYVGRENPDDVRMRIIGMANKMGFDAAKLQFLVIEQTGDLEKDYPRIRKEIEAFGEVALVIFDTSAALFTGDDENSNTEMLRHAKKQRKFCDLPGRPTVIALCHPTKYVASPEQLLPRGGGAYLNETDGNLTLWAHGGRLADLHWTGKFRGPDFEKMTFKMTTITTTNLTDSKGRLLPTVMAEVISDADIVEADNKAEVQENRLLRAILDRPGGSLAEWANDCGWYLTAEPGEQRHCNKRLVQTVIGRLHKEKLVEKKRGKYNVTKAGKQAINPTPQAA